MKYYRVVRLNPRDAAHSTSKALPVRFTDRAQAEEICAELNQTKPKKKATQVSLSKNAKNPDVCFRNRLDCWSIEARKIQTAVPKNRLTAHSNESVQLIILLRPPSIKSVIVYVTGSPLCKKPSASS